VAFAAGKSHKLVVQIDDNDEARMNLVLNNVANVVKAMHDAGEEVAIDVVAFGPGLNMLRDDTSPAKVKERVISFGQNYDNVSFKACANTKKGMETAEKKEIKILELANVVPSGVIHIMTRQEEGWSYLRP
jgi:intracellular sulfur oxidation DsrE/DsrF family protein